ncbi:hypothetical protein [Georgenia deserti]|uniref:Uncharacterized protein n=1 Tax=Georgenia deserti TaxID=2093781 RepID=A0ABW4L6D9_9MICO
MLRRTVLAATIAVGAAAAAGCDAITVRRDDEARELPDAAVNVDGTEVWDLRRRPTAGEVGLGADGETAVYETRPARPAMLRLPAGTDVRAPVRYIAFSAITSEDGGPDSLVVKTATMSLDETAGRYRAVLEQLGLPAAAAAGFHEAARAARGTQDVETDRLSARLGDLDIGVVADYSPRAETGTVRIGGRWTGE